MYGIEKITVSRDDRIYHAWPDLVLTKTGKLICVFTECEAHGNRDNSRIVMVESLDRGATWSEKRPITEVTMREKYYNNSRISQLNDGRLAVVCDMVEGNENHNSELCLWFSDDDGESWSEKITYPFCGIVPDKLKQLKCGRYILAAHHPNPVTKKLEEYLWYSDDGMKTWSERIVVGSDPRYNLCEASIFECSDGTLVAFMRENSFKGYYCMKTVSYDRGESWSEVYESNLPGCHRPVATCLKDGSIMITYRFCPGGAAHNQILMAAFTEEKYAKTTELNKQFYRIAPIDYDRSPVPDLGYTGAVTFDDGEIYLVTYINDNAPKGQIRGYRFRKECFTYNK